MKINRIFSIVMLLVLGTLNAQTKWQVDKSHSKIEFEVSHMVISSVTGYFRNYEMSVESESPDFENTKISFSADINSIDTENKKRDNHLKSKDFFNAKEFPKMIFVGKSFTKVEGNKYKLVGDMTMHGITEELTFDVEFNGTIADPWGNTRAAFVITGELNRFDFQLKWNKLLEAGGAVVGKTVSITCKIELIKEK